MDEVPCPALSSTPSITLVSEDDLRELASGFRKRTLVTAKLAGKMGLAMARRTLSGGKNRDADD